jgi:hypothetical protein
VYSSYLVIWSEPEKEEHLRNVFVTSGPMIHELTHLVVDYITGGNVPRWVTEDLSQYEEYRLTGFKFGEPAGLLEQTPYFFKTMEEGFDELPDQTLAYWQSLSAIQYIVEEYGKDSVHQILKILAGGDSIDEALYEVLGVAQKEFRADWWRWVTVKRGFLNNSRQELKAF